jgi:hypothetical protein
MNSQNLKNLAPIVLFVYNRPEHTRRTLEALRANRLAASSSLIVFSDGAKTEKAASLVEQVRRYIDNIDGFASVTVIKRDKNWGLANSIIDGVTQVVEQHGKIIVLEDDLITSPYFLDYMTDGLELYKDVEEVASVNAYMYPIEGLPETFFLITPDCWGWGTWKRAWYLFNSDAVSLLNMYLQHEKSLLHKFKNQHVLPMYINILKKQINRDVDSWHIRWVMSCLLHDKLALFPGKTMVRNIGLDGSGRHGDKLNKHNRGKHGSLINTHCIHVMPIQILNDRNACNKVWQYHFEALCSPSYKYINKIKIIIKSILKYFINY